MSPNLSSVTGDNWCISKQDDNGSHSNDRKPSENEGIEAHNVELHDEERNRNHVGETTLDINDESYQMTPPDPDIFSKPDEGDSRKNKENYALPNENAVLDKQPNGSLSPKGGSDVGNDPKSKPVKIFDV